MTDPRRSWPARLRAVLRRDLAELGMDSVPSDLTIRYNLPLGRTMSPWLEVRHDPGPTERMSVIDHVTEFNGSDEAIARFVEVGRLHVMRMLRRDARRDALLAAGHHLRKPPLHALEADALTALAFQLVQAGVAAIDGEIGNDDGLLEIHNLALTWEGRTIRLVKPGTMRLEIDGVWPESLAAALAGRPLGDAVRLPSCGDAELDRAAAAIPILRAQTTENREVPALLIQLERSAVVEVAATPCGEDGGWKAMRPVPLA